MDEKDEDWTASLMADLSLAHPSVGNFAAINFIKDCRIMPTQLEDWSPELANGGDNGDYVQAISTAVSSHLVMQMKVLTGLNPKVDGRELQNSDSTEKILQQEQLWKIQGGKFMQPTRETGPYCRQRLSFLFQPCHEGNPECV
ncbi:hypothetical protein AXG93_3296s1050 [Marchantia polymorpha subsp. ruderalis]|uniref:Uncharacterized protein n=1 Tax=Marchantia polymorpha subsp. ruderalis TaxID=1480154 RepID=A0A176WM84_MARPO|nr:hypothetical protein AXG93_3296s1050 [Marchantia polymorpha subsp. ruderalis]